MNMTEKVENIERQVSSSFFFSIIQRKEKVSNVLFPSHNYKQTELCTNINEEDSFVLNFLVLFLVINLYG
jgi:hypothetical protein